MSKFKTIYANGPKMSKTTPKHENKLHGHAHDAYRRATGRESENEIPNKNKNAN